jgi:DNA-directed RNA polymerase subunit N (RpoN/RPB10)
MLIAYVDLVARHTERRAPITLRFVLLIKGFTEGGAESSTRAPHTHLEYCCGRHMLIAHVDLVARRPRRRTPITWRLVRFLIKGVAEGATVSSTRAPQTHLECDCGRRMLIAYVDLVARHTERRAPITLRFDSSTKASSKAPP